MVLHKLHLTPGVSFITRILATKLLPIVGCAYTTAAALRAAFRVSAPIYIIWTASIAAIPLTLIIQTRIATIRNARRAAESGAVLVPSWHGKLPGNYDLLKFFMNEFENGYPGKKFLFR